MTGQSSRLQGARGVTAYLATVPLAAVYSPAPLHTAVYLAEAYAGLGDADRAIAWLRQYTPVNDLHFQLHLRCDPPFVTIEDDPRFRSLLVVPRPPKPGGC